ncbi:curli biogenesis system outer membrane secretion channel CsgG [Comamonas odontotermitis]|uniref:Curli biogenesis system outer membrane secretion channel CsgG n=1 Tax=Comamonas odontotermitis TaxID=379895 RepID=A0ABR6RHY7_9BURK|nr:CsgG/HfaB family protein [Comamonas odontotermitis]MBB6578775.1 curli biogenesis system outer membrane secretion channel CsgG [Comamonas odontotermitis]
MHHTKAGTVRAAIAIAAALALAACGEKKTELGEGGSEISGSAGPAGGQNAHASLERCDAPVATVALLENPRGYVMPSAANLPPTPVPLVRLLMQQSGCFRVVDRAGGLQGTIREGELQDAGVLRPNGTVEKRKGYEAQYTMVPNLTFSEQDAGRGLAGIIAMIPMLRDIAGLAGVAEQVKFKEAQTALFLTDNETTEQVAAATGSARATDLGVGGVVLGRLGGGAGAGWSNTNEGKVIAAAFLHAHNQLVQQVRLLQAKALPPPVATTGGNGHANSGKKGDSRTADNR